MTAGWSAVRALYDQCLRPAGTGGPVPPLPAVREAFAAAAATVAARYRGHEERFCADARAALGTGSFAWYYRDPRIVPGPGRRGTRPFESLVETARRRRDAAALRRRLAGRATSAWLTGSMSYGPFCSVGGAVAGRAGSDLDVLVVTADPAALATTPARLAGLAGVHGPDLDHLAYRIARYRSGFDRRVTCFSHKLPMWSYGGDPLLPPDVADPAYVLSLHVVPAPLWRWLLAGDGPPIRGPVACRPGDVHDFRDTGTTRPEAHVGFDGSGHRRPLATTAVDGGYLRPIIAHCVDDTDRYHPGFFQTMVRPEPVVLWSGPAGPASPARYRRLVAERLAYERRARPDELLRGAFAHVRYPWLPGPAVAALDRDHGSVRPVRRLIRWV
ncbi:hypothetical protein [Dactylosporangium sp. NPDC051541]|uniref:hypothetical protein n=1 Tax=Dactylosporangium sp. NPDC051541 TaxID=3363977 RepID=UPI0037AC36E4